jgi:hypothetical protein
MPLTCSAAIWASPTTHYQDRVGPVIGDRRFPVKLNRGSPNLKYIAAHASAPPFALPQSKENVQRKPKNAEVEHWVRNSVLPPVRPAPADFGVSRRFEFPLELALSDAPRGWFRKEPAPACAGAESPAGRAEPPQCVSAYSTEPRMNSASDATVPVRSRSRPNHRESPDGSGARFK